MLQCLYQHNLLQWKRWRLPMLYSSIFLLCIIFVLGELKQQTCSKPTGMLFTVQNDDNKKRIFLCYPQHQILKSTKIDRAAMFSFFRFLICHWKFNRFFIFCSECGWRKTSASSTCQDPCVICLEVECTVAAEGTGKLTHDASFNPANITNITAYFNRLRPWVLHQMRTVFVLDHKQLNIHPGRSRLHIMPFVPSCHCLFHEAHEYHPNKGASMDKHIASSMCSRCKHWF